MPRISRATAIISAAFLLVTASASARPATPINSCGTTIKTPGAYVVTKNLMIKSSGAASVACITVETSYISLDLGGFTINCGGDTNAIGISDGDATLSGIIVRNGAITSSPAGHTAMQ